MHYQVYIFKAVMRFAQSSYRINEGIGTLQVGVTVSEPFNVDIAVHIIASDISTTGMYVLTITLLRSTVIKECKFGFSEFKL